MLIDFGDSIKVTGDEDRMSSERLRQTLRSYRDDINALQESEKD